MERMSILDNYYWEWKSIRDKITELEEENKKLNEEIESLKLHIEAKDEAYMKLLKDYEKIKDDREYMKEKLENDLGKMLYYVNQNF